MSPLNSVAKVEGTQEDSDWKVEDNQKDDWEAEEQGEWGDVEDLDSMELTISGALYTTKKERRKATLALETQRFREEERESIKRMLAKAFDCNNNETVKELSDRLEKREQDWATEDLFQAISDYNFNGVDEAIKNKAVVNWLDERGMSPLALAFEPLVIYYLGHIFDLNRHLQAALTSLENLSGRMDRLMTTKEIDQLTALEEYRKYANTKSFLQSIQNKDEMISRMPEAFVIAKPDLNQEKEDMLHRMICRLLEAGADACFKYYGRFHLLVLACALPNSAVIIEALIKQGADTNREEWGVLEQILLEMPSNVLGVTHLLNGQTDPVESPFRIGAADNLLKILLGKLEKKLKHTLSLTKAVEAMEEVFLKISVPRTCSETGDVEPVVTPLCREMNLDPWGSSGRIIRKICWQWQENIQQQMERDLLFHIPIKEVTVIIMGYAMSPEEVNQRLNHKLRKELFARLYSQLHAPS
jgi:hypothetical protein